MTTKYKCRWCGWLNGKHSPRCTMMDMSDDEVLMFVMDELVAHSIWERGTWLIDRLTEMAADVPRKPPGPDRRRREDRRIDAPKPLPKRVEPKPKRAA